MLHLAAGPLLAIVIAAPAGPEDGCPSARQVTEAMQVHISGVLVGPDRGEGAPLRADALRSVLEVPADGTVVRFSLIDAQGNIQLRRTLQAPGRARPAADCLALAETIATIVERYLSSVPYQAKETEPPPPPPPSPPLPPSVGTPPAPATIVAPAAPAPPSDSGARALRPYAGLGWRGVPRHGESLYEVRLGSQLDITRGRDRLAALVHVSAGQSQHVDVLGQDNRTVIATASLWRMSAQAGLALGLPAGRGVIELALQAGVDLLRGETSPVLPPGAASLTTSSWHLAPTAEVRVGYRVALLPWLFLRPQIALGSAIVAYDIRRDAANQAEPPIFRTPTWFSTLALDAGFVFR